MHVFVVRPFGIKGKIDFDNVEAELIQPALKECHLIGATTGEIPEQGNIRIEMLERLIGCDLAIVDLTLNSPNVFYELGIRHGLRARCTILLRGTVCGSPDVPFNLRTDRYLAYDAENPQSSVGRLVNVIRATLENTEPDSPVHQLLPALAKPDLTDLLRAPAEFAQAVDRARMENRHGDLVLLGEEIGNEIWEREGLRLVGQALRSVRAFESAQLVWEQVQRQIPCDLESDIQLAKIFQRQRQFVSSDLAVESAKAHPDVSCSQKAKLCAVHGGNLKARWIEDWQRAEPEQQQLAALRSPFLERMGAAYREGMLWNPAHYYSAINALAAVALRVELAQSRWENFRFGFANLKRAKCALEELKRQREKMENAVETALESASLRGDNSIWSWLTRADLMLLKNSAPDLVRNSYETALATADFYELDSIGGQFEIYRQLGLFTQPLEAARTAVEEAKKRLPQLEPPERVILFAGHQIDEPGRARPRFPLAAQGAARRLIRQHLQRELEQVEKTKVRAYAGGANGGDILFFEVCRELRIPATVLLAAPRDVLVPQAVARPDYDWILRFDSILASFPKRVLAPALEPPSWISPPAGEKARSREALRQRAWDRCGRWILHQALAWGADRTVLVALCGQDANEGSCGTAAFVDEAHRRAIRVVVIDTTPLRSAQRISLPPKRVEYPVVDVDGLPAVAPGPGCASDPEPCEDGPQI